MQHFRLLLRTAVLLLLAATAVMASALSGEYPGTTAAAWRVATTMVLPLVLLAWLHLAALEHASHRRGQWWLRAAAAGDLALLIVTTPAATRGAPPLFLLLPVIAALLLAGTLGAGRTRANDVRSMDIRG